MAKQIIFRDEVREKIRSGINKLANAVKVTLGPSGRVVLSARDFNDPFFTKDGVTVAKEIELPDQLENMAAQIVRQATSKTASAAGDGTTTATIYVEAIYEAGLKSIANGAKAQEIKAGMDLAVTKIVEALAEAARPITSIDELIQVGISSANQDTAIGTIVAEAIEKVGRDGVVTIEEGRTLETYSEVVDGFQFNRGYLHPNFATDPALQIAMYEKPLILITDRKLGSDLRPLVGLMEKLARAQKTTQGFVIIAEDISEESLALCVVNHVRGAFKCVGVKAPGFGDRRREQLTDIATMTGATLVSSETGLTLDKVEITHLGTCEKITIDRDTTTIIKGGGDKIAITARIELIKHQLDNIAGDFDREHLQERLAKMTNGVARIIVGGATESEVRERKDRIDDALHACKAATEEGILPGGGVSALYAAKSLKSIMKGLKEDEKIGVGIIMKAVEAPLRQIAKNTGEDDGAILAQVRRGNKPDYGYNAVTGKYGDLVKSGVIVPAKVERVALQNAASVAGLLLTTDCMIAPIPEPKQQDGGIGSMV